MRKESGQSVQMNQFRNFRSWIVFIGTEAILAGALWLVGLLSPANLVLTGCLLLLALWIWERRSHWIPTPIRRRLGFLDKLLGTSVVSPGKLPSLKDLFIEDYREGKGSVLLALQGGATLEVSGGGSLELLYSVHADFNSLAVFMVFYIPPSDRTFEICQLIGLRHQDYINDIFKFDVHVGSASGPAAKKADLLFTGRVVIYHETEIDPTQLGQLFSSYLAMGLKPIFRSSGYALEVFQSKKINSLTEN
jgi:hypothetical protein